MSTTPTPAPAPAAAAATPAQPIVIDYKKTVSKRHRARIEMEDSLLKSAKRMRKAFGQGLDAYTSAREKSAQKKNGIVKDQGKNLLKGLKKFSGQAVRIPIGMAEDIADTKLARRATKLVRLPF